MSFSTIATDTATAFYFLLVIDGYSLVLSYMNFRSGQL